MTESAAPAWETLAEDYTTELRRLHNRLASLSLERLTRKSEQGSSITDQITHAIHELCQFSNRIHGADHELPEIPSHAMLSVFQALAVEVLIDAENAGKDEDTLGLALHSVRHLRLSM